MWHLRDSFSDPTVALRVFGYPGAPDLSRRQRGRSARLETPILRHRFLHQLLGSQGETTASRAIYETQVLGVVVGQSPWIRCRRSSRIHRARLGHSECDPNVRWFRTWHRFLPGSHPKQRGPVPNPGIRHRIPLPLDTSVAPRRSTFCEHVNTVSCDAWLKVADLRPIPKNPILLLDFALGLPSCMAESTSSAAIPRPSSIKSSLSNNPLFKTNWIKTREASASRLLSTRSATADSKEWPRPIARKTPGSGQDLPYGDRLKVFAGLRR